MGKPSPEAPGFLPEDLNLIRQTAANVVGLCEDMHEESVLSRHQMRRRGKVYRRTALMSAAGIYLRRLWQNPP